MLAKKVKFGVIFINWDEFSKSFVIVSAKMQTNDATSKVRIKDAAQYSGT